MRTRTFAFASVLVLTVVATTPVSSQETFQLSSKFYSADFVRGNSWNGQHGFPKVFCLTFPKSHEASSISQAMYNNNAIYYSRAMYGNTTGLFVVTSTVPAGRSAETEIGNLEAQNQRNVDAAPAVFKQTRVPSSFGPSLALTIRHAIDGAKDKPFPMIRSTAQHPDGKLRTASVHRLFVRGSDRIEVAGLRYFDQPVEADGEAEAIAGLTELVESAAESLQACTAKMPPRAQ